MTRGIQVYIKDLHNYEISPETLIAITDREWQSRPLESIYAVIHMDP